MHPLALLAASLAVQAAAGGPAMLAGEAVKVDLGRRQLVVRTLDPLRETAFQVDARTRMAAGGRPLELERVRPGEWVLVAYEPVGVQRVAVLVKVGAVRPSTGPRR
jgi:hypothetical protein